MVLKASLAVLAAPFPRGPRAQGGATAAWPARPIRLVLLFPPGASPNAIGRRVAERLTANLGRTVVVENRPGAGGVVGADLVAKAPPDGHVLGVCNTASHAVGPAVHRAVPYDPLRDFTHIALLAEFPLALAVAADGPIRDLSDFLAAARRTAGGLRVGTPGDGTAAHVGLEMIRAAAGAEIVHVPFLGGAAAATEAVAGRVEASFSGLGEVAGNDRVRLLALAARERVPGWPAVPTFREEGLDLVAAAWFGLCGPAGLPAAVADRLHREAQAAVTAPEVAALLAWLGSAPNRGLSRAETAAFVAAEAERWGDAARAAGVQAPTTTPAGLTGAVPP
jgi:tripartite-type tricarboxylate transporter receptor subunit TctC